MLYPLSYRGIKLLPSDVSVDDCFGQLRSTQAEQKRDRPGGAISTDEMVFDGLRGARMFSCFREHSTSVKCIINNFAHCGSFRVDVHTVTRF